MKAPRKLQNASKPARRKILFCGEAFDLVRYYFFKILRLAHGYIAKTCNALNDFRCDLHFRCNTDSGTMKNAHFHEPSPYSVIWKLMERVDLQGKDVLVDIGCGCGRVLIAGAHYLHVRGRGGTLFGIESSARMALTCRNNTQAFTDLCAKRREGKHPSFRIYLEDAVEWFKNHTLDVKGRVIFYCFNPFGPEVLRRVCLLIMGRWRPPQRVIFIYVNPKFADVLHALGHIPIYIVRFDRGIIGRVPFGAQIYDLSPRRETVLQQCAGKVQQSCSTAHSLRDES